MCSGDPGNEGLACFWKCWSLPFLHSQILAFLWKTFWNSLGIVSNVPKGAHLHSVLAMMILRPIQNPPSQMFWGKPWESAFPYVLLPQFSSVQAISRVWLFATSWTAARQASLSITNSQSSLKLMSIESVMPSNHLILCYPLLFLPSIFPSIRVFSNESVLHIRWPKY